MKEKAYERGAYKKSIKKCEICRTEKEMTDRGKYCSNKCKMIAREIRKKEKVL